MKNIIKELISYSLLIAYSAFMLFIFILISIYGDIGIGESNKIILASEIILCIVTLGLGIERLHNFIKRFR